MRLMTLTEILDSASALENQLNAGIAIAEVTGRLPLLQPAYADFWSDVTRSIEAGRPLSVSLGQVWPEALVKAVVAGEEAGQLEGVLENIQSTIQIQLEQASQMKKLLYPIGIIVVGIVIFIGIMLFVVPLTTESFASMSVKSPNAFTDLSIWMVEFFNDYWVLAAAAIGGGGAIAIKWATSVEGKAALVDFSLGLPYIGPALRDLSFALWARYVALMTGAGIGTSAALVLTAQVLPERLRAGVAAFERDLSVNNRAMDDAANPQKQKDDDPRHEWPFYISTAFMRAERTGMISTELLRVAPSLIKESVNKLNASIKVAMVLAMMIAGGLIALSFAAIYLPMFSAIRYAH